MSTLSVTFSYTGTAQTFQIPDGVFSVSAECWGAQGAGTTTFGGPTPSTGGKGCYAKVAIPTTPGEILYLFVGGQGGHTGSSDGTYHLGGYNGGGNGLFIGGQVGSALTFAGGGGGGASDVRQGGSATGGSSSSSSGSGTTSGEDRVLVAGGGGGGGCAANPQTSGQFGGNGGDASHEVGFAGGLGWDDGWGGAGHGGSGGKITGPGTGVAAGGSWPSSLANPALPFPGQQAGSGVAGTATNGGDGGIGGFSTAPTGSGGGGGGGGGGWFGGNGGDGGQGGFNIVGGNPAFANGGGGGGGGCSHSIFRGATFVDSAQTGNGAIILTYQPAPYAPAWTAPSDLTAFDPTKPLTLDWNFNPSKISGTAQAKYALGRSLDGGTTWGYWNGSNFTSSAVVLVTSVPSLVTLPANTFSDGQNPQFMVAATDNVYGGQSPFSAVLHLSATKAPTLVVTGPTGTTSSAIPGATWTAVLASGTVQTQLRVLYYTQAQTTAPGFAPGVTVPVADSGTVPLSVTFWAPTSTGLQPGTYVPYVQISQTGGMTSGWVGGAAFIVAYTQPPSASVAVLVGGT